MSEPFLAEIRIFAGNFAPQGWAFCDGTLMLIAQHDALFSLLGTIYGGDGRITFSLPNLSGRAPMHEGQGPGLSDRRLGETGGVEQVTLSTSQLPAHTHPRIASTHPASTSRPENAVPAATREDTYGSGGSITSMAGGVSETGGGQAHNNMQPYLVVNFIIALFGIYPSRS